jgi:hypothetical protein
VHKPAGQPPATFHHFESKKITKGIVYYADRRRELQGNPALAFHSPHKFAVVEKVTVNESKEADESSTDTAGVMRLISHIAQEDAETVNVSMKSRKRTRRK